MKIAIIGRSEILYDTAILLREAGHDIALVVTSKEAPEYTKTAKDFEALAAQAGCPFVKTAKIEDIFPVLDKIGNIDIAVSVNYAGIIPQNVIDRFSLGILNAHGGDLPRYRGNACQAWAILNGEDKIGLCIHRMIGGELDSGDIIARDYYPLTLDTTITAVWTWINSRVPGLFAQAVEALATDPAYVLEVQSKDPNDALRCYPRRPEDGRIDWQRSALEILRLINASNKPYAGAFCMLEGQKFIVWTAQLSEDTERYLAVPGQVTAVTESYIDVATGNGKLRISLAELNGETAPPKAFITSIRTRLE
ncbi:MAG: formyltransferase family protein [Alphaproteobacteria bacterium]